MSKLKIKIKERIFNIIREYVKRYLTGNLGKVVEDEEKITCYVKSNKCIKEASHYEIPCRNISEKDKELADIYKLNKPIYYVLDNLKFYDKVFIFGYNNCNIIIKNCKFDFGLDLSVNGKCILENTNIKSYYDLSLGATELILKNMNLINQYPFSSTELYIIIGADEKMEIVDSIIGSKKTDVHIESPNLNLLNSKINGDKVALKGNKLSSNNNNIQANEKVTINIADIDKINISSPKIYYNGTDISNKNCTIILNKVENSLEGKRIEIIELLKKLKEKCEELNIEKICKIEDNLNNQSINKILKPKSTSKN